MKPEISAIPLCAPVKLAPRRAPTLKQQVEVLLRRARCYYCGEKLCETGHEWDHRIPLAIGGKHESANLNILCPDCHVQKSRADMAAIAKAKRRAKQAETGRGRKRKGPPIKSRGFEKRFSRKFLGQVIER